MPARSVIIHERESGNAGERPTVDGGDVVDALNEAPLNASM